MDIKKSHYLTDEELAKLLRDRFILNLIKENYPSFFERVDSTKKLLKAAEEKIKPISLCGGNYWAQKKDNETYYNNLKLAAMIWGYYESFQNHWCSNYSDGFVSDVQLSREQYSDLTWEEYLKFLCDVARNEQIKVRGNWKSNTSDKVLTFLVEPGDTVEKLQNLFKEFSDDM